MSARRGGLGFFTGMWIIAAFSLVVLWAALRSGASPEAARRSAEFVKTLGSSGTESRTSPAELEGP